MAEKRETPYEDIAVFAPSAASEELLRQVDDAVQEINDHRPLTREVLQKLETDILYDRVHSSAVTEGNRLSRRETIVVLTSGVIEAGSRKDVVEVRNLAAAITSLEDALRESAPLSENLVRDLHKLLLQDLDDDNAGRYRTQNVAITGAKVVPPLGLDVPRLMHAVVSSPEINNAALHVLQRATWMHWVICRVHPFLDGNGRLARLLQDYILLKSTYVPAPLRSEDREGEYYSALEAADCGKGRGLLELVAKNTLRMTDRYLAVIREERAKQSWVANITKVATEKVQQTAHRKFLAVQRSSNLLKGEFFKHAGELDGAIPGLSLRFTDYGGIDFEKFQDLTRKGAAKRTWSFGLEFRIGHTALRYIFWHGVHRARPEDTVGNLPSDIVILVSAEEDDNYYRLLDDIEEDRVSIREAVPSGGLFWRRRYNPISERSEWDKDVSGGEIARTFIQEVLGKLGLV